MSRKPSKYATKRPALALPLPKTNNQKRLIDSLKLKDMVITVGPAGTGKSYLSTMFAAYMLDQNLIDKIILTRPTVPTGKSIGFLPGSLEEKMQPWVMPFIQILQDALSKGAVETHFKNGNIEIVPFEVIRGRTFDNAFILLDEAQNTTVTEIKAFVTRQGENSKTVINGDVTQTDLGSSTTNGLSMILDLVSKSDTLKKHVDVVEFSFDDIVRSEVCKAWVIEFHNNNNSKI